MDIYHDYTEAKSKLGFWKKKELEIRNKILKEMECEKDEGVVKKTVGQLLIKATYKLNRKIEKPILDSIYNELSDEEKEAVKYTPEIVMKNYRKLEEKGDSPLLDAVIVTPAQGTIEIKEVYRKRRKKNEEFNIFYNFIFNSFIFT